MEGTGTAAGQAQAESAGRMEGRGKEEKRVEGMAGRPRRRRPQQEAGAVSSSSSSKRGPAEQTAECGGGRIDLLCCVLMIGVGVGYGPESGRVGELVDQSSGAL